MQPLCCSVTMHYGIYKYTSFTGENLLNLQHCIGTSGYCYICFVHMQKLVGVQHVMWHV